MKVLVTIYADLEAYPPSLNAVLSLAERCAEVVVMQRSIGRGCWVFPRNVFVRTVVDRSVPGELDGLCGLRKLCDFGRFVWSIIRVLKRERPDLIIAYDPIPLLACRLALKVTGMRKVLWYHNHDTEVVLGSRRGSVGWWAGVTEKRSLSGVDIFSLPARERENYFPLQTLGSPPLLLPNYPSIRQYKVPVLPNRWGGVIRLVYQGSLGRNHGFQELVKWLGRLIHGRRWSLTLLGKIEPGFRDELLECVDKLGVGEDFEILDYMPFTMLPAKLAEFTIGLALHLPIGVTYSTGGTASNKIYEYAASGLPVLLYDSAHYREHLAHRSWVDFCSLDWPSFSGAVSRLVSKGSAASIAARKDFESDLNYERVFSEAWETIMHKIKRLE